MGGVGGGDGQGGLDVLCMGFMCLCVSCPNKNLTITSLLLTGLLTGVSR